MRDVGGVLPRDTGADDDDLGVGDAADAAHQHPAAALGLEQVVGPDLGRQAAGDLGHRVEQRQPARGQLHGLVGDRGDLALDQLIGQRLVGGQVQVGEQGQALAHPVVLLGHRLLDLQHHVRGAPHVVGVRDDRRPRRDVLLVMDRGALAGALLDVHLVAVRGQLVHTDGRDRHAVLVVLDFLRDADLHLYLLERDRRHTLEATARDYSPGRLDPDRPRALSGNPDTGAERPGASTLWSGTRPWSTSRSWVSSRWSTRSRSGP